MKTVPVVGLLLLSLAGCDRVSALFKHSEPAPSASGEPSAGASAAPSASTAKAPDAPVFSGFEGEIDLTMKGKSSPTPVPLNLVVKNDLVRVDLPQDALGSPEASRFTGGGKVYGILKASQKQMTVVLDGKKQAVVLSLDGMGDRLAAFRPPMPGAPPPPPPVPPTVTKTGKKDTVAGLACEVWDIANADKSKLDVCVADQGGSFFQLPLTGIPTEHAWALELLDGKHFPLRAVATDGAGGDAGSVEVTKLDKHAVDAAVFEIPADYKQMTIDEMIASLSSAPPSPSDNPVNPVSPTNKPHKKGHHKKH